MSDHFAAFSFVDRITALEPGTRATRHVRDPRRRRGVSRRACSPRRSASSRRGWRWSRSTFAAGRWRRWPARRASCAPRGRATRWTLAVEIEHCDDDAVAYRGHGRRSTARGRSSSIDCLGPMLPLAEFDDPAAMRDVLRIAVRRQAPRRGASRAWRCRRRVAPSMRGDGGSATATLQVPAARALLRRSLSATRRCFRPR